MKRTTLIYVLFAVIMLACNMTANINNTATPQDITPPPTATTKVDNTPTPTNTVQPTATTRPTQMPTAILPPVCNPRTDWQIYVVVAGDTLGTIANRVNATVNDLAIANCIANPNTISVGQQIRVPRLPATSIPPTPYDRTPRILYFVRTSSYPPMLEWRTENAGKVLIYISDEAGENRFLGTYDANSSIPAPLTNGPTTFRLTMRDVNDNDVIGPNGLPVYAIAQTSGGNPQQEPDPECPLATVAGTGMIDVAPIEASWSQCLFINGGDNTVTLSWSNMPDAVRSIEYWFVPMAGSCSGAAIGNPNVIATDMDVFDGVNPTWFVGYSKCAGFLYAFGYTEGTSYESGQRPLVIRQ